MQMFQLITLQIINIQQNIMPVFQLDSDHKHEPQQQLNNSQLNNTSLDDQNPTQLIVPQRKQVRRKIRIQSLPSNNPDDFFFGDFLVPSLEESMQNLQIPVFDAISEVRKNMEANVYYGLVEDSYDYLNRLYGCEGKNRQLVRGEIEEMTFNIHGAIIQDIMGGEFEIYRIKPEGSMYDKGTSAVIKIREQMLKAKISDLKSDLTISENNNNSSLNSSAFFNPTAADLYSPDNPKTKKAKEFVKRMRELQEEDRLEKQRQKDYREQKKREKEQEKREMEERMKAERHEFLRHQFEEKKKRKEQERRQAEEQSKKFKQFYKELQNSKPIFKKNEEQFFKNFVVVENNKKLQILKNIRETHRSISLDEIREHEKQYLELKEDNEYESNAARAMEEKAKKNEKKYYKSKFHEKIVQEEKQREETIEESEIRKQMHERKLEYATAVKTKFVPKVDSRKRKEMKEREEQINWLEKMRRNKRVRSGEGCKNDGKDNLQKLHRYIAEVKAKGLVKNSYRTLEMTPPPARYKNYLQQIRESGTAVTYRPKYRSIDYSSLAEEDAEKTKFNAIQKESSALRKQHYLSNMITNLRSSEDLDKVMSEKAKIDDDFLEAAKAKMALINKFSPN